MTQYAVLIYAPDAAGEDVASAETAQHDRHAKELADSGALVGAWALTPREFATSVRAGGVTDGPFVEAKEIVAGFYLLDAPDLDTAIAIARGNPAVGEGGGVEIRPVLGGGLA